MNAGNLLGGIETFLSTLARTTGQMAHEHAVCFEGPFARGLREAGAAVHVLGPVRIRNPLSVWRARCRLGSLIRRCAHDVVVAHGGWAYGLARRPTRACGRALALFAHGPPVETLVDRWAFRVAPDLVLANSRFTADAVRARFPAVPIEVVHPLVRPPSPVEASARARLRRELGAEDRDLVVVMVARLDPCKGHAVLLEALAQLPAALPWRAWVVGGAQTAGERRLGNTLEAAVSAPSLAGRVRLLGARSDVRALLAAADVYCQPNVTPDSFGMSFVEAMQAGLPVVTTALGGAVEVLGSDCGVLVPPGEPAALVAALSGLLVDAGRRRALGAGGPERARRLCDPATQLARLEAALEGAIAASGRGPP